MNNILCKTDYPREHACADRALLMIRIVAGIVFLMHGWGKLTGNPSIEMFSGMVGNLGFPAPLFFAWVVALTEFLGGISLILGIFVRPAGALLSVVMLVAFGMVKKFGFPAGEIDFVLLGISLSLIASGPGKLSLSHKIVGGDCCSDKDKSKSCCTDKEVKKEADQGCCNDSGQGCCGGSEHQH